MSWRGRKGPVDDPADNGRITSTSIQRPKRNWIRPAIALGSLAIIAGLFPIFSRGCAPAVDAAPTAECRDGTLSFSRTAQGTCSRHGGVKRWL